MRTSFVMYALKLLFERRSLHKFYYDYIFSARHQTLSPHQVSGVGLFRLVRFASSTETRQRRLMAIFKLTPFPQSKWSPFLTNHSSMVTMMSLEVQMNAH